MIGEEPMYKDEWGHHNFLVLCAFRYCLGRRTYIVSTCVDFLFDYWAQLDKNTQKLIAEEMRDALEKGQAGDPCDVECWQRLLDDIDGKYEVTKWGTKKVR